LESAHAAQPLAAAKPSYRRRLLSALGLDIAAVDSPIAEDQMTDDDDPVAAALKAKAAAELATAKFQNAGLAKKAALHRVKAAMAGVTAAESKLDAMALILDQEQNALRIDTAAKEVAIANWQKAEAAFKTAAAAYLKALEEHNVSSKELEEAEATRLKNKLVYEETKNKVKQDKFAADGALQMHLKGAKETDEAKQKVRLVQEMVNGARIEKEVADKNLKQGEKKLADATAAQKAVIEEKGNQVAELLKMMQKVVDAKHKQDQSQSTVAEAKAAAKAEEEHQAMLSDYFKSVNITFGEYQAQLSKEKERQEQIRLTLVKAKADVAQKKADQVAMNEKLKSLELELEESKDAAKAAAEKRRKAADAKEEAEVNALKETMIAQLTASMAKLLAAPAQEAQALSAEAHAAAAAQKAAVEAIAQQIRDIQDAKKRDELNMLTTKTKASDKMRELNLAQRALENSLRAADAERKRIANLKDLHEKELQALREQLMKAEVDSASAAATTEEEKVRGEERADRVAELDASVAEARKAVEQAEEKVKGSNNDLEKAEQDYQKRLGIVPIVTQALVTAQDVANKQVAIIVEDQTAIDGEARDIPEAKLFVEQADFALKNQQQAIKLTEENLAVVVAQEKAAGAKNITESMVLVEDLKKAREELDKLNAKAAEAKDTLVKFEAMHNTSKLRLAEEHENESKLALAEQFKKHGGIERVLAEMKKLEDKLRSTEELQNGKLLQATLAAKKAVSDMQVTKEKKEEADKEGEDAKKSLSSMNARLKGIAHAAQAAAEANAVAEKSREAKLLAEEDAHMTQTEATEKLEDARKYLEHLKKKKEAAEAHAIEVSDMMLASRLELEQRTMNFERLGKSHLAVLKELETAVQRVKEVKGEEREVAEDIKKTEAAKEAVKADQLDKARDAPPTELLEESLNNPLPNVAPFSE